MMHKWVIFPFDVEDGRPGGRNGNYCVLIHLFDRSFETPINRPVRFADMNRQYITND
jgi:hypothetical protein